MNINLKYNDHIFLNFADSPDTVNVFLHKIIRDEFEEKKSTVEVYVATCSMPWFPKVVAVDFIGEVIAAWTKPYIIWSIGNIMNRGRNPSFTVVLFVWSPQLHPERLSQVVRL